MISIDLRSRGKLKYPKALAKVIVVCILFFLIFRGIIVNWDQMKTLNLRLNYFYVALSFLIMKIAWIAAARSWRRTLRTFGHQLRRRDIYIVYFRSMVLINAFSLGLPLFAGSRLRFSSIGTGAKLTARGFE